MAESDIGYEMSWPWWRWVIMVLAAIALILSAVMSWHYLTGGTMAGCSGGSPCEEVLSSRWSVIAGIVPVSGLAVGVYLAIITASLFTGPANEHSIRRLSWSAMVILAGAVAGSAVWFTIIQKWFIGEFCPYCITAHITGLLLAALIIRQAVKAKSVKSPLTTMGLVLIGLAMAGILAASQAIFTPSTVYAGSKSEDNLDTINYREVPMTGSPDASYIVTLLFDYQCSHCQKLHFMLDEAVHIYKGNLAFALLPAPLDTSCNPYIPRRDAAAFKNSCELARIGLAVWISDPGSFPAFENWMFTFESGNNWRPRSLETSMAKAIELVGKAKFDAAINSPRIGQYIKTSTRIYGQTLGSGMGGIPKLIFGSGWVIPQPDNAQDLIKILQESLGVPGL